VHGVFGVYSVAMTKYSPEMVEEICKWLKEGNSQKDAATLAGISEATFYEWKQSHPEFSEELQKAETECKAARIARILKAGEKQWQADAWWLERKFKDEFARKEIQDVTQRDDPAKQVLDQLSKE